MMRAPYAFGLRGGGMIDMGVDVGTGREEKRREDRKTRMRMRMTMTMTMTNDFDSVLTPSPRLTLHTRPSIHSSPHLCPAPCPSHSLAVPCLPALPATYPTLLVKYNPIAPTVVQLVHKSGFSVIDMESYVCTCAGSDGGRGSERLKGEAARQCFLLGRGSSGPDVDVGVGGWGGIRFDFDQATRGGQEEGRDDSAVHI